MENQIKVGQSVVFKGAFCAYTVTAIAGKTATLVAGTEVIKKRVSSLEPAKHRSAYWDEQELADLSAQHAHGDVVYTALSDGGENGRMVWDEVLKAVVPAAELTVK